MIKMYEVLGMNPVAGDVGIEVEAEGTDLPRVNAKVWNRVNDGSLRGECCEFVLRRPIPVHEVHGALMMLEDGYKAYDTDVYETYRTSTHVHVNIQQLSPNELTTFILLYAMFEEVLVKYCGEHREGNFYCLRIKDAEGAIPTYINAVKTQMYRHYLEGDSCKYAAMNFNAIARYGSLEFRSMRGTRDWNAIEVWVLLLISLRDAAKTYNKPADALRDISGLGVEGLARKVFGDLFKHLPTYKGWEADVTHDMRFVQELAYIKPRKMPKFNVGGFEIKMPKHDNHEERMRKIRIQREALMGVDEAADWDAPVRFDEHIDEEEGE
jgi:hypothetical protein